MSININVALSDTLHKRLVERKGRESMANFLERFLSESLGDPGKDIPVAKDTSPVEQQDPDADPEDQDAPETPQPRPAVSAKGQIRSTSVPPFLRDCLGGMFPFLRPQIPEEDLYDLYVTRCNRSGVLPMGALIAFKNALAYERKLGEIKFPEPVAAASDEELQKIRQDFKAEVSNYRDHGMPEVLPAVRVKSALD
jgi:hypothetical protein